jgi:hypothetical protein
MFDFNALAKATPGYVGADLSALTGAAGIIAVKRIFQSLSDGSIVIPDDPLPTLDADAPMQVNASHTAPPATLGSSTPLPESRPEPFSQLAALPLTHSSIARFLHSHPGPLTPAQLAPLCITPADFMLALKEIQPSAQREGFATVPDVTWADIGALHATRSELHMAVVQPIRRPEIFRAVGIDAPAGVLLWGPPGCGKTLLAKAVANESQASFISVKGPELLNKVRPLYIFTSPAKNRQLTTNLGAVRRRERARRTPGFRTCARILAMHHLLRRARRSRPAARRRSLRILRPSRQHTPDRTRRARRPPRRLRPRGDQPARHARSGDVSARTVG